MPLPKEVTNVTFDVYGTLIDWETGVYDAFAKEASQLEVQLNAMRQQKEKLNSETFELQKQVELARVAKRTAELEIQRMTDMISKRAADSALFQGMSTDTRFYFVHSYAAQQWEGDPDDHPSIGATGKISL